MPDRRPTQPRYPTEPQQRPVSPYETQYIPQYDPGIQQMMAQALQQRQQRYDQSLDMISESAAQFGQIPNVRGEEVAEHVGMFTDELHNIAGEYGNDYGMARGALSRRIAEEAQNPFYQTAQQQAQQAEIAQQAQMEYGADALVVNDPRQYSIQELVENPQLLQTEVYRAPAYTEIGMQVMGGVQEDLLDEGFTIQEIEQGLRALRTGSVAEIDEAKVRRVAEAMLEPFKAATANRVYDDREGFEWVHDDEGIIEFLTNLGASQIGTKEQYNYQVLNPPESSQEFGGRRGRRVFSSDATYGDISEELSQADEIKTAVETVDALPSVIDALAQINFSGPEGVQSRINPEQLYANSETLPQDVKERWEEGEATFADTKSLVVGSLRNLGQNIEKGAASLGDTVDRFLRQESKGREFSDEIFSIFSVSPDGGMGTYLGDLAPDDPRYEQRGELLQIVAPVLDQLKRERDNEYFNDVEIVPDENGVLTIEFPDSSGYRSSVRQRKGAVAAALARTAREQLKAGIPGLTNQLEEAFSQIEEYQKEYPAVEELYNNLVEDGVAPETAMLEAVQTLTDTQRNLAAYHSQEFDMISNKSDSTDARREEESFRSTLQTDLRHGIPDNIQKITAGNKGDELSEEGRKTFSEKLSNSNIDSVRFIPVEGSLVFTLSGDPDKYKIKIGDIRTESHLAPIINDVQDFIKQGISLKGGGEDPPTIDLGGITYEYDMYYDNELQRFIPHIRAKAGGQVLTESADSEFLNDYTELIFTAFSNH